MDSCRFSPSGEAPWGPGQPLQFCLPGRDVEGRVRPLGAPTDRYQKLHPVLLCRWSPTAVSGVIGQVLQNQQYQLMFRQANK